MGFGLSQTPQALHRLGKILQALHRTASHGVPWGIMGHHGAMGPWCQEPMKEKRKVSVAPPSEAPVLERQLSSRPESPIRDRDRETSGGPLALRDLQNI